MPTQKPIDWNVFWTWFSIILVAVGFWVGIIEAFLPNSYGIGMVLILAGGILLWIKVGEFNKRN